MTELSASVVPFVSYKGNNESSSTAALYSIR
jgi:hypothetical protein